MIEIPVNQLKVDYKELLLSLTVDNPVYKNASFFAKGRVSTKIAKKIFFYRVNETNKSIFVPRGINPKYLNSNISYAELSEGVKIPKGSSKEFQLRPDQKEFFDTNVYPYIDSKGSDEPIDILINAECGAGKTVLAMALSERYRRKTIVCVTTKKIGQQFINTVKALFPNWTCGWEDGKSEYDITLGTYSLMSKNNYDSEYFSSFGHIVLDEYHRCGAETYSKILEKAGCKHRTSLTATPRRKDGLYKILQLHAGKVLQMKRNSTKATIYPIATKVEIDENQFRSVNRFPTKFNNLEEYSEVSVRTKKVGKKPTIELDRGMITFIDRTLKVLKVSSSYTRKEITYKDFDVNVFGLGTVSAPMLDTDISEYETRNDLIIELIRVCVKQGRKVILLSKRKDQLFKLSGTLKRYGIENGVFASEKSSEYKNYCKKNNRTIEENRDFVFNKVSVILGIDKLAEEGMDAPSFDTLIYAHPIKDIEQSIGRILRKMEGKKAPIGLFLIDKVNAYNNSFYGKTKGAKRMFEQLGHTVTEEVNIADIEELLIGNKVCEL